jgi:hypothetical protein
VLHSSTTVVAPFCTTHSGGASSSAPSVKTDILKILWGIPPVLDPYASLTPAELAAFSIDTARVSDDEDNEVEANNDEETEDDE